MSRRRRPGRESAAGPEAPQFLLHRGSASLNRRAVARAVKREVMTERPTVVAGEYRKTRLENGIRVVTERLAEVHSVALGVLIDAGPRDETPAKNGLAHLCEHLMFLGTSNRDALQIARVMDGAGGHLGAFTSRDYTCYFATVVDDYSFFALDLFGDLLLNSTYPSARIVTEQQTMLNEIRAANDAPAERVHALLKALAWPAHALGEPIAGRPETISALTREDVIYFVQRHYSPGRMIVAAAGHLEHEDFVASVRDAFWRLMGDGPLRTEAPPTFHGGMVSEERDTAQSYFALGIPAPEYAHLDRYGVHVLSGILGGGLSSRLFRRVREERGLAYHIASDYQAYRDCGMLVIEGSCAPPDVAVVVRCALRELWRLVAWDEPPEAEELSRAKTQLRGRHVISGEDTHTRMSRLATQELYFGAHVAAVDVLSHIDSVELPALRRIGGDLLIRSRRDPAVALLGPGAAAAAAGLLQGDLERPAN